MANKTVNFVSDCNIDIPTLERATNNREAFGSMKEEPQSMHKHEDHQGNGSSLMKLGMWVCCVIMLLPIVLFLAAGGTASGLAGNFVIFLPLVICLGAHFVMHKMMGKSCHAHSPNDSEAKSLAGQSKRDRQIEVAE